MRCFAPAFVALALLAGPTILFSAEKAKETPKPAPPAADRGNPVLKEVKFHGARLSDVIAYLRQSCPRFKVVLVPDPQCPDPDPALPDIELKNVELNAFLEVLTKMLPQLTLDAVDSGYGEVDLLKLAAPPGGTGKGVMGGGMGGMGGGMELPRTQVYRLSHLIRADAGSQGTRAAAMNDILSLVQAAVEAAGSSKDVLMKVHEATETLIFRGSPTQIEVVERALKALEPTNGEKDLAKLREQMQAEHDRSEERMGRLTERLNTAEKEAAAYRHEMGLQEANIETLKARLVQAQGEKKP